MKTDAFALSLAERLDEVFASALAQRRIVGAVALVARGGDVVYRRAHGHAERETARPMREDTLFRLASVTKPIVTACRAAPRGRGKLPRSRAGCQSSRQSWPMGLYPR